MENFIFCAVFCEDTYVISTIFLAKQYLPKFQSSFLNTLAKRIVAGEISLYYITTLLTVNTVLSFRNILKSSLFVSQRISFLLLIAGLKKRKGILPFGWTLFPKKGHAPSGYTQY